MHSAVGEYRTPDSITLKCTVSLLAAAWRSLQAKQSHPPVNAVALMLLLSLFPIPMPEEAPIDGTI